MFSEGWESAGAIKLSDDTREVAFVASSILDMTVKGETPTALLIEEVMNIERELYCAVTWNYSHNCLIFVASVARGIDMETVAREWLGEIAEVRIDPWVGFLLHIGRHILTRIGLNVN